MPQRILFKRLQFAYGSAATIIGVLILLAQIIIQSALYSEIQTRTLASTMSLQELRSQYFLRISLMSFDPGNATINPLKISIFQQINMVLTKLETTNKNLLDSRVTPQQVVQSITSLQPDFIIMDQAGHHLLVDMQKHDKKDQSKQVVQIFIHEQSYLSGVYSTFVTLTQQADDSVARIQLLEIVLFLVAEATITFEAFCVVVPAFKDYQHALKELERVAAEKKALHQRLEGKETN